MCVCVREREGRCTLWDAVVLHNSICVSVVDDIAAGDDATAGACDEATAGNDAGSYW